MDRKSLINKLNEYIPVIEKDMYQHTIDVNEMSMLQLRDNLLGMGHILEEDFDNQIYVINILAGFANKNPAVVVVKIDETKLNFVSYAKEGIINQHTAEKAVNMIVNKIKTI